VKPAGLAHAASPATSPPLVPITDAERAEILTLIARRETIAANEKITALLQRDYRAAWPHVALAELHMRNLWRHDMVRQWLTALNLEPALRDDPRLAAHLCQARGAKWEAAGVAELWAAVGGDRAAVVRGSCAMPVEVTVAAARPDGSVGGAIGSGDAAKLAGARPDEGPLGSATAGNAPDAGVGR
jgi:hypothetical protein